MELIKYSSVSEKYKQTPIRPMFFTLVHKIGSSSFPIDAHIRLDAIIRTTKSKIIRESEQLNQRAFKLIAGNIDNQNKLWKRNYTDYIKREQLAYKQITKDKELIFKHVKKAETDSKKAIAASAATLTRQDVEKIIEKRFADLAKSLQKDLQKLNEAQNIKWLERQQLDLRYDSMRRLV